MGNPFKNRFPLWECVDFFVPQMGKVFIKRLPVWGIDRNFYFQNQLKWSEWSMVRAYRKRCSCVTFFATGSPAESFMISAVFDVRVLSGAD